MIVKHKNEWVEKWESSLTSDKKEEEVTMREAGMRMLTRLVAGSLG